MCVCIDYEDSLWCVRGIDMDKLVLTIHSISLLVRCTANHTMSELVWIGYRATL